MVLIKLRFYDFLCDILVVLGRRNVGENHEIVFLQKF